MSPQKQDDVQNRQVSDIALFLMFYVYSQSRRMGSSIRHPCYLKAWATKVPEDIHPLCTGEDSR